MNPTVLVVAAIVAFPIAILIVALLVQHDKLVRERRESGAITDKAMGLERQRDALISLYVSPEVQERYRRELRQDYDGYYAPLPGRLFKDRIAGDAVRLVNVLSEDKNRDDLTRRLGL